MSALAETLAERVRRLVPAGIDVRVEVAQLLRDLGRVAESRVEAEKALKLEPDNEAARKLKE